MEIQIDTKYMTVQAKALDIVSGATAYKTILPYWVESHTTDQATAREMTATAREMKATACIATLLTQVEPKISRLVTQDSKTKQTRTKVEVDPVGAALAAVKLGAAPSLAPTKGAEVGTAQPKVCGLKGTSLDCPDN